MDTLFINAKAQKETLETLTQNEKNQLGSYLVMKAEGLKKLGGMLRKIAKIKPSFIELVWKVEADIGVRKILNSIITGDRVRIVKPTSEEALHAFDKIMEIESVEGVSISEFLD